MESANFLLHGCHWQVLDNSIFILDDIAVGHPKKKVTGYQNKPLVPRNMFPKPTHLRVFLGIFLRPVFQAHRCPRKWPFHGLVHRQHALVVTHHDAYTREVPTIRPQGSQHALGLSTVDPAGPMVKKTSALPMARDLLKYLFKHGWKQQVSKFMRSKPKIYPKKGQYT